MLRSFARLGLFVTSVMLLLSSAAFADSYTNIRELPVFGRYNAASEARSFSQAPVFHHGNDNGTDNLGGRAPVNPTVPVPEPSSLVLTGMGMLGLVGVIRRKVRL